MSSKTHAPFAVVNIGPGSTVTAYEYVHIIPRKIPDCHVNNMSDSADVQVTVEASLDLTGTSWEQISQVIVKYGSEQEIDVGSDHFQRSRISIKNIDGSESARVVYSVAD